MRLSRLRATALFTTLTLAPTLGFAQQPKAPAAPAGPWMNASLDPDARADMMIKEMTLDEKILLVHGDGWGVLRPGDPVAEGHNGGAGFVKGIPRLGLPAINLADSAVGVRMAAPDSRYATLLPSVIGMAASFDEKAGHLYGQVIGRELRDQGYNMSIGGGMDLIREPRNGRNFEYASEDPLLSGIMVGHLAMGVQSQTVMGDIKHYVLNDQETGRNSLDAQLNRRAMQETDLLSFNIGIHLANPAGVMCSYNRVNADYACENDYTLNKVLKDEWGFKGFVLSDWDGTHSTAKAANAGLDMEQPGIIYFGDKLKAAVQSGEVPQARLDNMVHRIVRSMFAVGVIDHPPTPRSVTDPFRGKDDARHIESEGIVLLQNKNNLLPLKSTTRRIVVIGAHADIGVLSGGGSAQVDSPGGNALDQKPGSAKWGNPVYFPSVPLKAVKALADPAAEITFNPGTDAASAAAAAKGADVVLFFAEQWMSEGMDRLTLALPQGQDAIISAVAAANPNTVVILETGGPVSMPWAPKVSGILATWFPGIGGAEAIADVLFGRINPSGKLPVTFAANEEQLPHPRVDGLTQKTGNNGMNGGNHDTQAAKDFPVNYNIEGMAVGYKWFQQKNEQPLFPFGFGLSYTQFGMSNLQVAADGKSATLEVKNTGSVAGDEIAQLYVTLPKAAGEPFRKLAAFKRVSVAPGASETVHLDLNPLVLSTYSTEDNTWHSATGEILVEAGNSSATLPLHQTLNLR